MMIMAKGKKVPWTFSVSFSIYIHDCVSSGSSSFVSVCFVLSRCYPVLGLFLSEMLETKRYPSVVCKYCVITLILNFG